MVNNLTPGSHVKIPDIQDGQLPVDNILVYGEFRKKGNPQVLSQQADDEFRVANLQKGVYLLALGRQILVQDKTVAGVSLGEDKGLVYDQVQVQAVPAHKGMAGGGDEHDVLRLFQDFYPFAVIHTLIQEIHYINGIAVHHLQQRLGGVGDEPYVDLGVEPVVFP